MEGGMSLRSKDAMAVAAANWTAPTWAQLVRDHTPRVYRLALRLTGDPHDAEDLTQDVFVRAFNSIHNFRPGTIEGWLHRITTNLFLDGARRRGRIRMDASSQAAEHVWGETAAAGELHADQILDGDIAAALAALPPKQRVVVVLCDIEGLSYEEIADVLDLKVGTVRSRISRGRAALRDALAHRAPLEGRERYQGVS